MIIRIGSIELLNERLKKYTLDPTFETYGNFVQHRPDGMVVVSGNFHDFSSVFRVEGTPEELDETIELIRENQRTERYAQAKQTVTQWNTLREQKSQVGASQY